MGENTDPRRGNTSTGENTNQNPLGGDQQSSHEVAEDPMEQDSEDGEPRSERENQSMEVDDQANGNLRNNENDESQGNPSRAARDDIIYDSDSTLSLERELGDEPEVLTPPHIDARRPTLPAQSRASTSEGGGTPKTREIKDTGKDVNDEEMFILSRKFGLETSTIRAFGKEQLHRLRWESWRYNRLTFVRRPIRHPLDINKPAIAIDHDCKAGEGLINRAKPRLPRTRKMPLFVAMGDPQTLLELVILERVYSVQDFLRLWIIRIDDGFVLPTV